MSKADENIYNKYIDSVTKKELASLPEGYTGEVPDHIRAKLPFSSGLGGTAPAVVENIPPMGNVPPAGMMNNYMAQNMGTRGMPVGNVPQMPSNAYEGASLDTMQPHTEGFMNAEMQPMGMPQMGMPQMNMPQMGMPQMGMPQMGMPQMGMPQMGMPQMGMQYMGMPPMGMQYMGMPQMGGSKKYKIVSDNKTGQNNDAQKKKDFFF
jgi:hypothetical protein